MLESDRIPLEAGFHPAQEKEDVNALRAARNAARTRWRMTHVSLFSAARNASRFAGDDLMYEAHDEHLAALHQWKATEASYIAARLGFLYEPLPPRTANPALEA